MRKIFVISATFFTVLGIVFAVFPLGTIPILPIGLALISTLIAFLKSNYKQKKYIKLLLLITLVTFLVVIGKDVFIKNKVIFDKQFEQSKIESNKEDLNDLEGLK